MTSDANVMSAKPDFPDWLSPMLIKELRQGMRSRAFLFSFLAVQAAMIFLGLIGLLNSSVDSSTEEVTVFFWIITGVPILLIMPFSGLGAIAREKTANTLELIFLTRLTARRIIFGKWVAIVAQTLLLVTAILPYAVMRYYLGGVNITTELKTLAWMLAGSALLSSITVAASPFVGRVGRAVLPFAIFILAYIGLVMTMDGGGTMMMARWDWRFLTAMGVQTCCLVLLMLEVGAGKIAPAAENHSTPRRLIALVSIVTALIYSYVPAALTLAWWPVICIAGPVLISSVCEPVREVPSIYRPFIRFGFAGRALGRVLYPGWASGVLFSLILLVALGLRADQLATATHYARPATHMATPMMRRSLLSTFYASRMMPSSLTDRDVILIHIREIAYFGAFFLPVALLRLFRLKIPYPSLLYFVTQCGLAFLSLVGYLVTEYGTAHARHDSSGLERLVACIPTTTLFLYGRLDSWSNEQLTTVLNGVAIVTLITLVVVLIRIMPAWRAIRELEKTAATLTPTAIPSPDAAGPGSAA
jgi:ABC-type transport system involved in multi-copper enzyme maturation permease subunit